MTDLARYTLWLAASLLLLALPLLFAPCFSASLYRKLPCSVWIGRLLSAVALLWGGRMIYLMPFEFLQPYRHLILPLIPVVVVLTWWCMDELLAARSVGALAVLIPSPLLAAVRIHPSDWRLVISVWAYVMVITGMVLLLSPYRLRDALDRALKTPAQARLWGAATAVCGLGLGVLGIGVL